IQEDSATGTSAAALSCLLYQYGQVSAAQAGSGLVFEQGYAISQPSEIVVRLGLSNDAISEVWVAGRAQTVSGEPGVK
ncbi:MAG: PhzF family phenazine biosynthesis protein, partial [Deltaproteobacteria bacterium]|nr:PhzF family phenazine biosynthesis protein [Deltaproteobacteria bacterium]